MERLPRESQLSDDERTVLREVLESSYRDMKAEIGRTEDSAFKAELQARRDTLKALIEKLVGPAALHDEL